MSLQSTIHSARSLGDHNEFFEKQTADELENIAKDQHLEGNSKQSYFLRD